MVKNENLDVWPLSNWELVSHFFIFRSIADAICHTLFYEREIILLRYAGVYSNQFTPGKSPFQLVQCSTVLNSKKTEINLMKTGIGQSKYRNLTLFHVVWSVPAKVFLTHGCNVFNSIQVVAEYVEMSCRVFIHLIAKMPSKYKPNGIIFCWNDWQI